MTSQFKSLLPTIIEEREEPTQDYYNEGDNYDDSDIDIEAEMNRMSLLDSNTMHTVCGNNAFQKIQVIPDSLLVGPLEIYDEAHKIMNSITVNNQIKELGIENEFYETNDCYESPQSHTSNNKRQVNELLTLRDDTNNTVLITITTVPPLAPPTIHTFDFSNATTDTEEPLPKQKNKTIKVNKATISK